MKTELSGLERAGQIAFALVAGVLVWSTAINSENFSVNAQLPVAVELPEQYVVTDRQLDSVQVTFTGTGMDMLRFQIAGTAGVAPRKIDFSELRSLPSSVFLSVSPQDINTDDLVDVSRLLPQRIQITVDTIITRSIPVAVRFSDGIPSRFRIVTTNPDRVAVSGPSCSVLFIDSIVVDNVTASSTYLFFPLAVHDNLIAYDVDSVAVCQTTPAIPLPPAHGY